MREILFRGKRKGNGEWVYGNYCGAEYLTSEGIEHLIIEVPRSGSSAHVLPETVGQYTGLTDKNGKKIYEGDILRYTLDGDVYTYACFWDDGNCEFGLKNEKRDFGLAYAPRDIEVIGNIHDNPELLKGGVTGV